MTVLPFRHRAPLAPPIIEPSDDLIAITTGGVRSALNLTMASVIKVAPGRLAKILVVDGGAHGGFVLNDCASLDTAGAENMIIVLPSGARAGTVIDLDWPCAIGIVLSAVPDGGSPILAISYC
jgi:hypothetical protein